MQNKEGDKFALLPTLQNLTFTTPEKQPFPCDKQKQTTTHAFLSAITHTSWTKSKEKTKQHTYLALSTLAL